jgi:hypothetical protein
MAERHPPRIDNVNTTRFTTAYSTQSSFATSCYLLYICFLSSLVRDSLRTSPLVVCHSAIIKITSEFRRYKIDEHQGNNIHVLLALTSTQVVIHPLHSLLVVLVVIVIHDKFVISTNPGLLSISSFGMETDVRASLKFDSDSP